MNLKEKYSELLTNNKAILAANFYNFETLKGVLLAANELNSPIILQLSKSSIDYLGLKTAVNMAKTALKEYDVNGWLHLDHGDKFELVQECLDAGFDSVMIDGSELSFEENMRLTYSVVKLAERYDVPVEAELGYVSKLGQVQDVGDKFTKIVEAKLFYENTGIDALAISVGTAHGFYKETPKLNFDRIEKIRKILPYTVLVLHGSSGIEQHDINKSIQKGINKINVATELKSIFMQSIRNIMLTNEDIDLRKIFPAAIHQLKEHTKINLSVVNNHLKGWSI